jgi:pimeloyl-ACP methyl ester carboxylesterase
LAVDVGGVMVTTAGSVLFGEHRLAYDVTGTGPTVVLIPGVMMHRGRWHALDYVERLAVHYQIVATDPLGHGESDKPVVAAAYDLNCCADHVVAVLDDVGVDRAAIWGYSRGGAIAAAMVGHRPDRLWAVVTGGFGFRETPTWPNEAVAALEAGDWDGFFARSGLELPDHVRQYMTELNDPAAIAAAIRGSRSSELVAVASPVPVLMYNGDGEDDDVLDSRAAEAVGFVCRVLPTGGHAETFAAVEQVLTVVEPFLATAAPPAD